MPVKVLRISTSGIGHSLIMSSACSSIVFFKLRICFAVEETKKDWNENRPIVLTTLSSGSMLPFQNLYHNKEKPNSTDFTDLSKNSYGSNKNARLNRLIRTGIKYCFWA